MATMSYPNRTGLLSTRRHLMVLLTVVGSWLALLLSATLWQTPISRVWPVAGMAVLVIALGVHCVHFLGKLEGTHSQPTEEMTFIFELVTSFTLAANAFLMVAFLGLWP